MALLLHPTALSLGTPTPQSPLPLSVAPLPLPSRFPSSVAPRAAVGANIFVFAPGRPVVWEYDGRGRRLSELSIGRVEEVAVLSSGVAVLTDEGVKVMRRAGKKWEVARTLEVPPGEVYMVGEGRTLVLVGQEVWAYDSESGDKTVLNVDPPKCACVAQRKDGASLVVPCPAGIQVVPLEGGASQTFIIGAGFAAKYIAVGECVAAADGRSVALVSLDDGKVDTVEFEGEVSGVAWLESSLAATVNSKVFLYDPKTGIRDAGIDNVTAVYPIMTRSSKPAEKPTQPTRVLSDSNAVNVAHEEPKDVLKAKAKERIVSAPGKMLPPPVKARPLATPSNPMLSIRPDTGDTLRLRPPAIPEGDERSPAISTPGYARDGPSWEAFEEMRREIANLQLDMLRMGRGLKNEIRSAVAPLVDELRESRETIARQAAEIERLRRGF